MKAKVYRSGEVAAPLERGCERESYLAADAVKPEGRQGRTTGIFASPTLSGVTRWVRANHWCKIGDVIVRELTVDADAVYVYEIRAWERVSNWSGVWTGAEDYWATGMTLTEWLARGDLDPAEWELLLSREDIATIRPVGDKRVAAAATSEYDQDETARALKGAREALRWRRAA